MFAFFLQHEYTGRYAGAVKDIGRQADHCIEVVSFFNEVFADMSFGATSEQYTVRQDTGHGAGIRQLIYHVLHKSKVSCAFRGKSSIGGIPVITHK